MPQEPNKVWVTVSYTVNLKNYESMKIEAGESASINDYEDPAEIRAQLETNLINEVSKLAIKCKRRFENES